MDEEELRRRKVEEEMKRREADKATALDLFSGLIGQIAIQHEWLNGEIRDALKSAYEFAGVPFEEDITERLLYPHSAFELRGNFISTVSATFKRLTPALQNTPEFAGWIDELDEMLKAENNARNYIIHSVYKHPPDSKGIDELLGSTLASQKKGRYAILRFNRPWMIDFIGFQKALLTATKLIAEDIDWDSDIFGQSELHAPDLETMNERMERSQAGEATPEWLVHQYLGHEILGNARTAYKKARIGDLQRFYSDRTHGEMPR